MTCCKRIPVELRERDREFQTGRGAVRLEARRPGALALTLLDEGERGRMVPHPSKVRRVTLECGAALDVAEVLGRLSGIRAMVLDTGTGKAVPLDLPGGDGRIVRLAPGRDRTAGATLALTDCGTDGRPVPGTVAEVEVPARAFLALARALRRWGLEALEVTETTGRHARARRPTC